MAENLYATGPGLLDTFDPDQVLDWCALEKTNANFCEREYFLTAAKRLPDYDESKLWFTYPNDSKSSKPQLSSNRAYYLLCVSLFTSNPHISLNFVSYLYAIKKAAEFNHEIAFVNLSELMSYRFYDPRFEMEYVTATLYQYDRKGWFFYLGINLEDQDERDYIEYIYDNPNIADAHDVWPDRVYDYYSKTFADNLLKFNKIELGPNNLTPNGLFAYYTVTNQPELRLKALESIELISSKVYKYLSPQEASTFADKLNLKEFLGWIFVDNNWSYFIDPFPSRVMARLEDWPAYWVTPITLRAAKSNGGVDLKISGTIKPYLYAYYKFAASNGINFKSNDIYYWNLKISLLKPNFEKYYQPALDSDLYYMSDDPVKQKLQELSLRDNTFGVLGKYYNLLYAAYTNGNMAYDLEYDGDTLPRIYAGYYITDIYTILNNITLGDPIKVNQAPTQINSILADWYFSSRPVPEGYDTKYVLVYSGPKSLESLPEFNKLYTQNSARNNIQLKRGQIPPGWEAYPEFLVKATLRDPDTNHLAILQQVYDTVDIIPEEQSAYWLHFVPLIDADAFAYLLPRLSTDDLSKLIPMTFALTRSHMATLTQFVLENTPNITLPLETYTLYQTAICPVWKHFAAQVCTEDQLNELYDALVAQSNDDVMDITRNYIDYDTFY